MLDGALFIVKCARYGNPGENACSDFFLFPKRFFKRPDVLLQTLRRFKKTP